MHLLSNSIAKAVANENWFAAMFISLSLPGVCGRIEYQDKDDQINYAKWFDQNLQHEYKSIITGLNCYYLHEACLLRNLTPRTMQTVERFHFVLPGSNKDRHKTIIDGVLQVDICKFCSDITNAFEAWHEKISLKLEAQKRLEDFNKISKQLINNSKL